MRSTHSFAINFIKRVCGTNRNHALLYARISLNGERVEISLKEKITAKDWDGNKEIVKGKSIEVKALNQHIDDIRYQIKSKYRLLQDSEMLITAGIIKQAYLGIHQLQKSHKLPELSDYYNKIWKEKLSKGSFKNYKTTIGYMKLFITACFNSKDIYLSQLNMEFITEFEHYVRNFPIKKHDPCLGNGTAKHIQRLKRIINWAVELKWITINPIEKYSCPVKKNKRKKLTIQQLVTLELRSFQDPALQYVKDLFLFSCYTGLAFADVMQLQKSHFEWDVNGITWCKIYRQKSDVLSQVPLLKNAAKIVEQYKHHPDVLESERIFPATTNQNINKRLKVIQEICDLIFRFRFMWLGTHLQKQ